MQTGESHAVAGCRCSTSSNHPHKLRQAPSKMRPYDSNCSAGLFMQAAACIICYWMDTQSCTPTLRATAGFLKYLRLLDRRKCHSRAVCAVGAVVAGWPVLQLQCICFGLLVRISACYHCPKSTSFSSSESQAACSSTNKQTEDIDESMIEIQRGVGQ
jgi:hypothetical protein